MESRIFLIKNVKDIDKTKALVLEKVRTLVSADASLSSDTITVSKVSDWAESKGTIMFAKVGKDLEMTLSTTHSATSLAMGAGCLLLFFGLLLIVVPWVLYDQEKKRFSENLANILNYAIQQG
jgi:hypothetical protein